MNPVEQNEALAYHANKRRRSKRRLLAWLGLLLFVPGMLWYAAVGDNRTMQLLSVALSTVFVWAIFLGRHLLFGHEPLLSLSDSGIHSFQLKLHDQLIAWDTIADADIEGIHANYAWLRLDIKPEAVPQPKTKPLFAGAPRTPKIFIGDLTAESQTELIGIITGRLNSLRRGHGDLTELPSVTRDRLRQEFQHRLDAIAPTPWAVYLLIALLTAIWIANVGYGMHFYEPTPADLYAWGGNATTSVVLEGQAWRLFTSIFIHSGLKHLLLNLFALAVPGVFLCRWAGNARFLLIYVLCGLAGSAWSLHFGALHHISVGASGSVIGIVGAIIGLSLRNRVRMPRNLVVTQVAVVIVTMLEGHLDPQIDLAAHVGALLLGFIMGLMLIDKTSMAASRRKLVMESGGLAALACLVVSLLAMTVDTKGAVNMGVLFGAGRQANALLAEFDVLEDRIVRDAQSFESGRIDRGNFDSRMDDANIPAYEALVAEMANIAVEPDRPSTAYWSLMKQNKSTRLALFKLSRLAGRHDADEASVEKQLRELQSVLIVENMLIKRLVVQ